MNKKELKIKKILVGICGIGNGHINRQICVIKELLKNNYEVLVATESCKIQTIKDTFKNVKVIKMSSYYSVFLQVRVAENITINEYLILEKKIKSQLKFANKLIRFIDIELI